MTSHVNPSKASSRPSQCSYSTVSAIGSGNTRFFFLSYYPSSFSFPMDPPLQFLAATIVQFFPSTHGREKIKKSLPEPATRIRTARCAPHNSRQRPHPKPRFWQLRRRPKRRANAASKRIRKKNVGASGAIGCLADASLGIWSSLVSAWRLLPAPAPTLCGAELPVPGCVPDAVLFVSWYESRFVTST